MIINEYAVSIFGVTITTLGFDADDVAKYFPNADSITVKGSHYFIGDGSSGVQSLTKAQTNDANFVLNNVGSAHNPGDTIPTVALEAGETYTATIQVSPAYIYRWKLDTETEYRYGSSIEITFDAGYNGSVGISASAVGEGGESQLPAGTFVESKIIAVVS